MIITRQFAKSMDKRTLAELASDYATGYAHLLGYDGEVRIGPDEIIFNKKEAKAHFLKKFEPRSYPKSESIRELARFRYQYVLDDINNESAFVQDGVAFIPLAGLSTDEMEIVEQLRPDKSYEQSLFSFILDDLRGKRKEYASLNGFGGEIGHLVGAKIFSSAVSDNLDEALDVSSQLFEFSKNVEFLSREWPEAINPLAFTDESLKEKVSCFRRKVEFFETLLFEGESATMWKMVALKYCSSEYAEPSLRFLRREYMLTKHYDGIKLFVEVVDSVGGDLAKAYLRLGGILADPDVKDMASALGELGYTPERLAKYQGMFGGSMFDRAKLLESLRPTQ
jgi:hypothetical protein